MKIGPPPPVLPLPRQDGPAGPDADRPGDRGTRRFDELGVFGLRRRPAAGPEGGATPRCPAPTPSAVAPRDKAHQANAAPSPPGAPSARLPSAPPLPKPVRPHVVLNVKSAAPDTQPKGADPDAAGTPLEVAISAPSEFEWPGETQPGGSPVAGRPAPEGAAAHRLVVTERDGRLAIVAGAPPLDGEGRALLRRLVRDILAGRGMSLADFQLNGASLAADFQEMAGGSHGTRPR